MHKITRRSFTSLLALGGGALALPGAAGAKEISVRDAFRAARRKEPWTLGLENARAPRLETARLHVTGKIPADLRGTFYRNGPALHERAGLRYRHWFDGDGMVQAFRIADGQVRHRGRFVETLKYRSEEAAGRFLRMTFGTAVPDAEPVTGPDGGNAANTSVLPLGDEVLALWEGGSAYRLDGETLDTLGPKTWRDDLRGMPFSAHPRVEPDGRIWNFGMDYFGGRIGIFRISAQGGLEDFTVVPLEPAGMVHDFVMTARHLVFVVPSLVAGEPRLPFLAAFQWRPELGMRVIVLDKDDLTKRRIYELPAGFQFHFGNAWEERDGTIRFDFCCSADADFVLNEAPALMRGTARAGTPTMLARVTLPPRAGAGRLEVLDETAEFPRLDPRRTGRRNALGYYVTHADASPTWHRAVAARNWETDKVARFDYGPGNIAEEHVFVPRPGGTAENAGWLLGTTLDLRREITVLNIFDAANVAAGPVARAALPYPLPLGFHGAFRAEGV